MVEDEYTLVLVKPDGVKTRHIGDIITRIERKGYRIEALKMINATQDELERHYYDKTDKPFWPEILTYMMEGPIVGMVVSGTNVVEAFTIWPGLPILVKLNGGRFVVTSVVNGQMAFCETLFTLLTPLMAQRVRLRSGFPNLNSN